MSHDDFDPPNKHEKKEFRHLPISDLDQRGYSRQEYEVPLKFKKTKTTAIALAIVSSLLVCGVGYELAKHNIVFHIGTGGLHEQTQPAKRKSLLVSTPKEVSNKAISNVVEDEEDYQLNFLKEQNKQQAAKIKILRQELLGKMHNVQELKAHLFKYNRTHDDKILIGDLQRNLLEKMQQNDQLKLNISSIEHEAFELDKKISQLEVTRDTLMGMLEKQQLSHHQEIATLKNEIAELNNSSKTGDLEKRAQMLEIAQKHLTDSLLKKNGELEQHQKELAAHQHLLNAKTTELESLLQKHNVSKMEIRASALDLIANVEFESVVKEIAERNFHKAMDEKGRSIEQLEKELSRQQKSSATSHVMMTEKENEFNLRNRNLIWALELEALRNEYYGHEHDKAVKQQVDKLHASKQDIAQLQKTLEQQAIKAVAANEQIAGLSDLHSFHQQKADLQLRNIAISHELESTKAALLSDQLQDALLMLREVKNDKEDLQRASYENLLHVEWLNRKLTENEQQQLDHELQWYALTAVHQKGQEQAGEQARRLADIIETERLQNQRILEELAQNQKERAFQKEQAHLLEAQLEEIVGEVSRLEAAMQASHKHLELKDNELHRTKMQVSLDLDEKNRQLEEIVWEVSRLEAAMQASHKHLEAKDDELHRTKAELSLDLDEKIRQLEEHQLRLEVLKAAYQNVHKQAGEQAQRLADVIDTERLQNQHLKAEFENLIKNEQFQKQHLADELISSQTRFTSQEELTNLLSKHLEEIVQESSALEEALILSKELLESKHRELQNTKTDLNRQLEENERYLAQLLQNTVLIEDQLLATKQQLDKREDALNQSQSRHQETQDQLVEQKKLYSAERDRVDYLESDLVDYLQQISRLESNIDLIADRFEKETELRSRLESELSLERQKHELVMAEYAATKAHLEDSPKNLEEKVEKSSTPGLYGRFMRIFE